MLVFILNRFFNLIFLIISFQQLMDLVSKMENEKERDIIIDNHLHGSLIGSKGNKIQEIRDTFNQVQIIFPEYG